MSDAKPAAVPGMVRIASMAAALRLVDDWIEYAASERQRADRLEWQLAAAERRFALAYYAALHRDALAIEAIEALGQVAGYRSAQLQEDLCNSPQK